MNKLLALPALLLATGLTACTTLWDGGYERRDGSASSLVEFLYPDGRKPEGLPDRMPYLELPVRVGIAFVPSRRDTAISAQEKIELLDGVAAAFRERPYVEAIEVIPDTYLTTARGVTGMQQVAALFDVDVMALVSHDQVALSGERDSAIFYWTVVGALVVKGNVNEVQTMIDTAVFDVETGKLLFRAPGTHRDGDRSTLMDSARDLRRLRQAGFEAAAGDMTLNLNHALEGFREQVREGERARVAWKPGHSGGGAAAPGLLLVLACLLAVRAGRGALLVYPAVNNRPLSRADFRGWQGAATSNSGAIARSRNAARREKTPRSDKADVCGGVH